MASLRFSSDVNGWDGSDGSGAIGVVSESPTSELRRPRLTVDQGERVHVTHANTLSALFDAFSSFESLDDEPAILIYCRGAARKRHPCEVDELDRTQQAVLPLLSEYGSGAWRCSARRGLYAYVLGMTGTSERFVLVQLLR